MVVTKSNGHDDASTGAAGLLARPIPAAAESLGAGRAAGTGRTDVDLARTRQEAAAWADSRLIRLGTRQPKRLYGSSCFRRVRLCLEDPDHAVAALRERRTVRVDQPNPRPITDPLSEMLITSNILLTLPADLSAIDDLRYLPICAISSRRSLEEQTVLVRPSHSFGH